MIFWAGPEKKVTWIRFLTMLTKNQNALTCIFYTHSRVVQVKNELLNYVWSVNSEINYNCSKCRVCSWHACNICKIDAAQTSLLQFRVINIILKHLESHFTNVLHCSIIFISLAKWNDWLLKSFLKKEV